MHYRKSQHLHLITVRFQKHVHGSSCNCLASEVCCEGALTGDFVMFVCKNQSVSMPLRRMLQRGNGFGICKPCAPSYVPPLVPHVIATASPLSQRTFMSKMETTAKGPD